MSNNKIKLKKPATTESELKYIISQPRSNCE